MMRGQIKHTTISPWRFHSDNMMAHTEQRAGIQFSSESAEWMTSIWLMILDRLQPVCLLEIPMGRDYTYRETVVLLGFDDDWPGRVEVQHADELGQPCVRSSPFTVDLYDNAMLTIL